MEAAGSGSGRELTWAQWREVIAEWAASGQSMRGFSREHGVDFWKMYRRHIRMKENQSKGFVEIVREKPDSPEKLWVEAGRWRIHVSEGFDAGLLRSVAEALS